MPTGKDVSEKILEDHNDVFADIVNNLLFDGREVVKADELENAATVSQLKMADGLHEQERDTASGGVSTTLCQKKRKGLVCVILLTIISTAGTRRRAKNTRQS